MSNLMPSERESIVKRLNELYAETQDAELTLKRCDEEGKALFNRLLEDILDSVKAPNDQGHDR